ncbi:hypothetical protein SEA_SKOG_84 [Gordonia phage Skog]|uniref:Uncharacterized protein n=1 Tax=Gordonia phage Skog TaxID=2704033 RepID=A0A6G6XJN3_9CAUD|nr:hypothetical protein KHQ85_gp084 [Gordonia phage Skog]QIG58236.1 hypothetical protein SEA_SKOG_84 [Gordonia phage Skog]
MQAVRRGIEVATHHEGPFEFGHYIERFDGGENGDRNDDSLWTPIIYEADSLEDAVESRGSFAVDIGLGDSHYRRSEIVRRAVSPWEVFS